MDLIAKAASKQKVLKYQYNGNYYSRASKRLRENSSKIQAYIHECEDKLREINADTSDSYGDVITDFQEGIRSYKTKISYIIEEAERKMKSIDLAADKAYEKAEKYYRLAEEEKRKSIEN